MGQLEDIHGHKIGRARAAGMFAAFTANNTKTRDAILKSLQHKEVECGGSGAYTVRLRPSMIFMPQHANEFLNILDDVLHETEIVGDPSDWNAKDPRNIVNVEDGTQGEFH